MIGLFPSSTCFVAPSIVTVETRRFFPVFESAGILSHRDRGRVFAVIVQKLLQPSSLHDFAGFLEVMIQDFQSPLLLLADVRKLAGGFFISLPRVEFFVDRQKCRDFFPFLTEAFQFEIEPGFKHFAHCFSVDSFIGCIAHPVGAAGFARSHDVKFNILQRLVEVVPFLKVEVAGHIRFSTS